ncbi:MAG: hypothetical protein HY908_18450 [Myxococcales bacterium]|nr:hypothetical protein [Myxococcales bacterium]
MSFRRTAPILVVAVVAAGLLASSTRALADVPGPRARCEVEGLGCELCWRPYGGGAEAEAAFGKCRDTQGEKGLVEACSHRQGAGDNVYFCPAGTKPELAVRGGCAGCEVGAGARGPSALGLGLGLALALGLGAWWRRRARRGRAAPPSSG